MVYLLVVGWIITTGIAFWAGYNLRSLTTKIEVLEETVKKKIDKKPVPEEPQSTVIDVLDPVQEAIWERDQLMKKMNNEQ